jgi:nicotinamide phosphoribosyltransferase
VYPSGIISIVSDTWDLWKVLTDIAPSLRTEIEAREGKVVFRPDSGDPVKIICGYRTEKTERTIAEVKAKLQSISGYIGLAAEAYECKDGYVTREGIEITENEVLGCMQILDREFGSTVNDKGFKELNPKVGLIYGDSITFERAQQICQKLKDLGFASTNIVFGIGSYTYQYNTRDTFSIACKATWVQVDGEGKEIYKDPVTDDGTKKSACGLLSVVRNLGTFVVQQNVDREYLTKTTWLDVVFRDGVCTTKPKFDTIRKRLRAMS